MSKIPDGKIFFNATNLEPEDFVIMDTSNRVADGAGLPQDIKRNLALDNGVHGHGRTCECYPCQQSNYRMNRDDPSVGGFDECSK